MLMLTSTSSSACPVNEQLGLGWEVIIDDIVQERQVNATSSHISDNEDAGNACPELAAVDTPCYLNPYNCVRAQRSSCCCNHSPTNSTY